MSWISRMSAVGGRVSRALPRGTARVVLADLALAVVVTLAMSAGTRQAAMDQVPPRHALDALGYLLVALGGLSLSVRRIRPFVTFAVTSTVVTAYLIREYPYGPIFFCVTLAVYSAAVYRPPRQSLTACGLVYVVTTPLHLLGPDTTDSAVGTSLQVAANSAYLLVPWTVGTLVRLRREYLRTSEEEQRRHRADEERLRIAREVHDVVGHGLAVINMQAGIALHVLERRPEQATVALEAIKKTSKTALDELRVTLAVFRQPGAGDVAGTGGSGAPGAPGTPADRSRAPSPGLAQVDALVGSMAEHGVPVTLERHGAPGALPSAVEHAGYRIVQESLTNVLRHAGGAAATVRISHRPDGVEIEVVDTGGAVGTGGTGPGGAATGGGGLGIPGMRERAAAVSGTLEAGPRPEGGFGVRAWLPSGEPAPADVAEPTEPTEPTEPAEPADLSADAAEQRSAGL